ncbi:MAG: T9SS type A sorting domain-containing protein [Bacteroidales bacterium]|nr:T9SS type A sorting domain-containing protein [Bacteroidales bacterium]MDD3664029.1 T9SS type A sorting domain-containing protein [Bacteroidales bacterium]
MAKITITAEASDNAATYDLNNLITSRPQGTASLPWTVAEEWGLWEFYRTPDIKTLIQEVVNRGGWAQGNALALMFKGENQGPSDLENAREVEAFENIADPEDGGDGRNHPERVPKLMIYYTAPTFVLERAIVQNGANDTIELSTGELVVIATSSDDAEQEQDAMDALNDDDLDIGWEGEPEKMFVVTAGLRFQNMTIPQGAIIDSAFIRFTSHEGKSAEDVAKITIKGEASDNAATYDLNNLITSRPYTTASVPWTVDQEWGLWENYHTPNIGSIVQEIVNRSGWNYGNAMAFMLTGENQGPSDLENAREVESFENIADPEDGGDGKNHPERVPQIVVYYRTATGIAEATTARPSFVLSPNPSTNHQVKIVLGDASAKATVKVYTRQGQEVLTTNEITSGETISLHGLTKGLYLITVMQNGTVSTQKLIVE